MRPVTNNGKEASCCSSKVPDVKCSVDPKVVEGLKPSTSKLPSTMDIVIHGQLIKARIMQTGKSYMNTQLVQQLRKERYAAGVNITSEPLNVQEVGFVVEGSLSVERLAQVEGLSLLVTKDAMYLKPVELFFNLFALNPATWSKIMGLSGYNPDEPLVGLSLADVSIANVISDNILVKGVKTYPITLKTDQGARYAMAASVAPSDGRSSDERNTAKNSIIG